MENDFKFVKSVFRSSPVYYGAMDLRDNLLIYSNDFTKKLLHYSAEQMQKFANKDFEEIVHADDHSKLKEARSRLWESIDGEVIRTIIRIKRSDGQYLHVQLNDTVYERDSTGAPQKFSTVAEDVTSEAKLKKSLEENIRVIDRINYKNSHEIRGQVSSLMGLINLVDSTNFKSEYHHEIFLCLKKTVKNWIQ